MNGLSNITADLETLEDACFFVDISALAEISWTGIAQVAAHTALQIHRRFPEQSYFFVRDQVVDPAFMIAAIEHAQGPYLDVLLRNGHAEFGRLTDFIWRGKYSVGIFPNVKTMHHVFDLELVVLHDLSAMLMPELHENWAADLHTAAMARDTESSELICCVSEATRQDALAYLAVPPEKLFVSQLGVAAPAPTPIAREKQDFVLVLGTVEPRKNLTLVAQFLQSRRDILADLPFIFAGRRGWGPQFNQIFGPLLEDPAISDRIVFTGYVDETDKWALIRAARFAIFPSLFEGFGLPVLECMAGGCPVITSRSSSLVEFGLPPELYFDPFSLTDFSRAFRHVNTLPATARTALGETLQRKAAEFTWDGFAGRMIKAIEGK